MFQSLSITADSLYLRKQEAYKSCDIEVQTKKEVSEL